MSCWLAARRPLSPPAEQPRPDQTVRLDEARGQPAERTDHSVTYYGGTTDTLVVGTFGRGAWSIGDASSILTMPSGLISPAIRAAPAPSRSPAIAPTRCCLTYSEGTSSTPAASVPFAALQETVVHGAGAAVQLTLDAGQGTVVPLGALTFDGGTGASSLLLTKGHFQNETYTPLTSDSGTLSFDGAALDFTNLSQPVQDDALAGDFVLDAPDTANQVFLTDGAAGTKLMEGANEFLSFNLQTKSTFFERAGG